MKKRSTMADSEITFEWMVESIPWIIGSPDDCVRQLHDLDEAVGGFGTLLLNGRDWVTTDRYFRSLEMFQRYVAPQFNPREHQEHRSKLAAKALGREG